MSKRAVVLCQFLGRSESNSECGYCKGKNEGNKSTISGFFHLMDCDSYEKIMCRQWRRCGNYYYQPQNDSTCCPQYTIRLDCTKYKMPKSHKRVLKKVNVFLGKEKKKAGKIKRKQKIETFLKIDEFFVGVVKILQKDDMIPAFDFRKDKIRCMSRINKNKKFKCDLCIDVVNSIGGFCKKNKIDVDLKKIQEELVKVAKQKAFPPNVIDVVSLKNGWIGVVLKEQKKEGVVEEKKQKPKPKPKPDQKRKKKEKEVKEEEKTEEEEPDEIITKLMKAQFIQEEYELYKSYQIRIHKDKEDEIEPDGYKRFLIDSSLTNEKGPLQGLGTYHLQYRLKKSNKLIAVSVLDVLPHGVSSVYFFYHEDYEHLRPGVYSGIREIEMIQKENIKFPEFKYYYLGFYIHSCVKMKYKSQFHPSELMCNVSWNWAPFEKCKKVLDEKKFGQFSDKEVPEPYFYDNTLILFMQSILTVNMLPQLGIILKDETLKKIKMFHNSLGECSKNIAYYIGKNDIKNDLNGIFEE